MATVCRDDGFCADAGGTVDDHYKVPRSALLQVLQGVIVAIITPEEELTLVLLWISTCSPSCPGGAHKLGAHTDDTSTALSLHSWRDAIELGFLEEAEDKRELVSLALGVTFLREKSRQGQAATAADLTLVWGRIHCALTCELPKISLCGTLRSAQGFMAVPLCSLVKDGCIDELFRMHVWLPDRQRGSADFAIHSHQPFAHSWILAGEGKDYSYKVDTAVDSSIATHAKYARGWSDNQNLSTAYKTHQTSSVVVNTGKLVYATLTESALHTRDMNYSIPAAKFHQSEVLPDILRAILFFFDASPGFGNAACVLGPKDGESFTQPRDPAGITSTALASMADAVRPWEIFMRLG